MNNEIVYKTLQLVNKCLTGQDHACKRTGSQPRHLYYLQPPQRHCMHCLGTNSNGYGVVASIIVTFAPKCTSCFEVLEFYSNGVYSPQWR